MYNKLETGRRAINAYHHASRGAHLISYKGSVDFELAPGDEGDYLHISITRGPGRLSNISNLDMPYHLDFQFTGESSVTMLHQGDRVNLQIPPGLPLWQLKIMLPGGPPPAGITPGEEEKIIIGESGET